MELKRKFLMVLGVVATFGAAAVFAAHLFVSGQIQNQDSRNAYLRENIEQLDQQVEAIRDMQRQRTQLLDRMSVIQELQGNRLIIVRLLDQLVRTIPDGVFYTELKFQHQAIAITGIAQSNNRVSSLMRRLDASDWFTAPDLEGVRAEPTFGEQAAAFNLVVQLQPSGAGDDDGSSANDSAGNRSLSDNRAGDRPGRHIGDAGKRTMNDHQEDL